jgi:hypothetical protein
MQPSGKQVAGPCYDLAEFQAQVQSGNVHVYKTRALNIIRALRGLTREGAVEYAKRVVLSLQPGDYAHTLKLPHGQMHDVYGKLIDAEGWYVKIEIHMNDGQPGILSCHPAEYDLVTVAGILPRSRNGFDDG